MFKTPETPSPSHRGEPVIGYVLKMYPRFSETFIVSEILAREAAGERIVIFSMRPSTDTRFHPELAKVNAQVVHVPRSSTTSKFWKQLTEAGTDPRLQEAMAENLPELMAAEHDDAVQAATLAKEALDRGVTHLHAHMASMSTQIARLASRLTGIPYSFTAHAKDIFHEDVDEELLGAKIAESDHAVTISQYNVESLRRRFPESAEKVRLVYNGIDLQKFSYQPKAEPAGASPRLLAVGRLVEKKGFGLLVDAVARLRARGLDVTADIAGDGPMREELRARIEQHGLQEHVRMLGPRTQAEVTELMSTHDVFVAPFVTGSDGNIDGLPTVLLEAMARGIRCVAGDVSAVGEVVRPGETGWLVPEADADALTEAVAEAAAPGQDFRALTDAARALVEERFDSARQAQQLRGLTARTEVHA